MAPKAFYTKIALKHNYSVTVKGSHRKTLVQGTCSYKPRSASHGNAGRI